MLPSGQFPRVVWITPCPFVYGGRSRGGLSDEVSAVRAEPARIPRSARSVWCIVGPAAVVPQRLKRLGPSVAGYPQSARPASFFVLLLSQPLQGVEAARAELEIPTKIPGSARLNAALGVLKIAETLGTEVSDQYAARSRPGVLVNLIAAMKNCGYECFAMI